MRRWILLLLLLFTACSEPVEPPGYKIGRDRSFYPLNLMGKERYLLGYIDELFTLIGDEEKIDFSLFSSSQNNLLNDLRQGNFDGVVTYKRLTPSERGELIASKPFFLLGPVIVVTEESKITSYSDLKNKTVGILQAGDRVFEVPSDSTIIYTSFDNMLFALRALAKGEIDAVIMNAPQAYEYTSSFYAGVLKILWPPLTQDGLRLVVKKNREGEKLISSFNEGLKKAEESGKIKTLQERWDLYQSR